MPSTDLEHSVPESFNLDTAAKDFAGPDREIDCPHRLPGEVESGRVDGPLARRQMLVEVNGWTLSAVWGFGTYCTAARPDGWPSSLPETPPVESPDAEIAVWKGEGKMLDLHGDTVEGWVSPAAVLKALEAMERDDEAGIRAALVRRDL